MGNPSTWYGTIYLTPNLTPNQVKIINSFNILLDEPGVEREDNRILAIPPVMEHGQYHSGLKATEDGSILVWDECEDHCSSTDSYVEFFIKTFFKPWKITANGSLTLEREYDEADNGILVVKNNKTVFILFEEMNPSFYKNIDYSPLYDSFCKIRKQLDKHNQQHPRDPNFYSFLGNFLSSISFGINIYNSSQLKYAYKKFKKELKSFKLGIKKKKDLDYVLNTFVIPYLKNFPESIDEQLAIMNQQRKHVNVLYHKIKQ